MNLRRRANDVAETWAILRPSLGRSGQSEGSAPLQCRCG